MPLDGSSGGAQIIANNGSSGGYAAISGNDAYVQLAYSPSGVFAQLEWTPKFHMAPGNLILAAGTRGIRFQNYVAGKIAIISAGLSEPSEPPIQTTAAGVATPSTTVITPNTTLPGSPTDGQQAILVDSTTAPTYAWLLQFNAALAQWLFIGGSPLYAEVLTQEGTTSAAYTDLATVGPSITLPRAGSYTVEIGCRGIMGSATSNYAVLMSYAIGGTGAVDADFVCVAGNGGTADGKIASVARARTKTGIAAATTLTSKYRVDTAGKNGTYDNRWIRATPIAVT